MPAAKPTPGSHPADIPLDLGDLIGSEWRGFIFRGRRLAMDGWRGDPFGPGELRALWWQIQQLRSLQHRVAMLESEKARAEARADHQEERAEYYRRQLRLESAAGLMLSRVLAE